MGRDLVCRDHAGPSLRSGGQSSSGDALALSDDKECGQLPRPTRLARFQILPCEPQSLRVCDDHLRPGVDLPIDDASRSPVHGLQPRRARPSRDASCAPSACSHPVSISLPPSSGRQSLVPDVQTPSHASRPPAIDPSATTTSSTAVITPRFTLDALVAGSNPRRSASSVRLAGSIICLAASIV